MLLLLVRLSLLRVLLLLFLLLILLTLRLLLGMLLLLLVRLLLLFFRLSRLFLFLWFSSGSAVRWPKQLFPEAKKLPLYRRLQFVSSCSSNTWYSWARHCAFRTRFLCRT